MKQRLQPTCTLLVERRVTPLSDPQQKLLFGGEDYRDGLLCRKGSSMIWMRSTPRFNTGPIAPRSWQPCLRSGLIRGHDIGGGRV